MEIGIIGLPQCGKTTIFNALTGGDASTSLHASGSLSTNIGIAKVYDERLDVLKGIFMPKKVVPAEVRYVDIAGLTRGFGKDEGVGGKFLNIISGVDALLHVVRVFEDDKVPHIDGDIDPVRDLVTMDLELMISDVTIIDRRLVKIEEGLKGAKPSEREQWLKEKDFLLKIKQNLELEIPIWQQGLTQEQIHNLSHYQFLSAKPLLVVLNIDESQLQNASDLEDKIKSFHTYPQFRVVALCGKLEMDLAQMTNEEASEFRADFGLMEPALEKAIKLSYELLGLLSFFTTVSGELKAWTVPCGTTALRAAGKIHTDIERGFIKAEVVRYADLTQCGSMADVRKQGLMKLEGKNYIIQDGDTITFLFNI